MFTAVLFTIAKKCKQPKCPPTDEWIVELKKPQLKLESRQACRGRSHTLPCILNYSKWEETTPALQQKGASTIQKEEENFSPPHDSPDNKTVAVRPMRSLYALDSQLPPMDSLFLYGIHYITSLILNLGFRWPAHHTPRPLLFRWRVIFVHYVTRTI